ncbi:MAG: DUF1080 domain-containing protein [Pirellulales bacterium]|nr:DUF1080 domain-containing protein [Pirellulales bacterium]
MKRCPRTTAVAVLAMLSVMLGAAPPPSPAAPPESTKTPVAETKADDKKTDDPYAWKSLFDAKTLTGWKAPKFGGEGEVKVEDGMIILGLGDGITGATYTGELPKINYEVTLEGKRLDGNDFFCTTTFPVGDSPCTFVVGGWGGTVVGLSNVDFYDAADNVTTNFHDLKKDTWYRIRIRVSDSKIEAWIGDDKLVDLPTEGHKFSIRWEVDLCKPLGIASWCTKGAVRDIRIRKLKPEEVKQIAEETAKQKG